jgi:hypothetical protein
VEVDTGGEGEGGRGILEIVEATYRGLRAVTSTYSRQARGTFLSPQRPCLDVASLYGIVAKGVDGEIAD